MADSALAARRRANGGLIAAALAAAALLAVPAAAAAASAAPASLVSYVDTRIGTGGAGFGIGETNPGPQVPYGAMRLGPDTSYDWVYLPFNHFGGYYFNDSHITAFSHTHLVGAGVGDWGNVGVTAVRHVDGSVVSNNNYRSKFSHATETAEPGYYAIDLDTHDVTAELTVSGTLSGIHRYTCHNADASSSPCIILVDVCHTVNRGDACKNATVEAAANPADGTVTVQGGVRVAGSLTQRSSAGGVDVFYYAIIEPQASAMMSASGLWENTTMLDAKVTQASTTSHSLGAFATYLPHGASGASGTDVAVQVRVGISWISAANAKANLMAQQTSTSAPDGATTFTTFEEARAATTALWESELSRVQIAEVASPSPADAADLKKFYSGMYRASMAPTQYNEVDNAYLGFDFQVHQWNRSVNSYMSDMSIWDIHRTQMPWLTLVAPERARDTTLSLITMTEEGGHLPRWPLANVFTGCMVGSHAVIMITDGLLKGLAGVDTAEAYRVVHDAVVSQDATKNWTAQQYVAVEQDKQGASLTLDFAFDDWAASMAAAFVNNSADQKMFYARSQYYRNGWNSTEQLMCPRHASGAFSCPSDPYVGYPFQDEYTEASAWEYQYFVPGDPAGLVTLYPSPAEFVSRLHKTLNTSLGWFAGNVLPNPYYWAGNEPDLLVPWQFNFAGPQYASYTQYWTRMMLKTEYSTFASGVPGNDDFGTMSAWETFAYLGLYPQSGSSNYMLGSPRFSNVSIVLPTQSAEALKYGPRMVAEEGREDGSITLLTVVAHDAGPNAIYVAKVQANGVPLTTPFVQHSDLTNHGKAGGGLLEFWMTDSPVEFGSWT